MLCYLIQRSLGFFFSNFMLILGCNSRGILRRNRDWRWNCFSAFNLSNNSSIWKTISCDNKYKRVLAWPSFFYYYYFLEEFISHGKPKSHTMNINAFLFLVCSCGDRTVQGHLLCCLHWQMCGGLSGKCSSPPFALKAAGGRWTKKCPRVLTHCPLHPPAKGTHSDLC